MSDKYYAWMAALIERDRALIMLFFAAAAIVAAWIAAGYIVPASFRKYQKNLFIILGIVLYAATFVYLFTIS